jgi:hypothetical protein
MTGFNMEKNTETRAAKPFKASKDAYNRTPKNGSNWIETVPGPADFAAGYAVPDAPNHGDVFEAASIAKMFFETSFAIVKGSGNSAHWINCGCAEAAATLANACATVYAAQLSERQRKPKKTAP